MEAFPGLLILEQESLTDVEIDETTGKKVHVVVKNTPFFVRIGFVQTGIAPEFKIDFRKLSLEAQLLYDCGEEKEVDFIKELPLEYITTFSDTGEQIILEVKIKVLTSQLEDMLFILKITAMDSVTKKIVYPHFYSHPIRVVSKPPRLLKRKAAEAGLAHDPTTGQPCPQQPSLYKKKSFQQNLQEVLARIDEQHEQQKMMIQQIAMRTDHLKNLAASACLMKAEPSLFPDRSCPSSSSNTCGSPDPLEKSFQCMLQAYQALSTDEKPKRIRTVLRKTTQKDAEKLAEMIEAFYNEGLNDFTANHVRAAAHAFPMVECVHKKELDNLNSFFDLFQTTTVDS